MVLFTGRYAQAQPGTEPYLFTGRKQGFSSKNTQAQIGIEPSLFTGNDGSNLTSQIEYYLLSCDCEAGQSKASLKNIKYQLGRFNVFCQGLGIVSVDQVTAQEVRLFMAALQKQGNKPVSVGSYLKRVKAFYSWLVSEGKFERSPIERLKAPKTPHTLLKPFSDQQIEDLLFMCSQNRLIDYRNRAMILTMLDTGLRVGELINMNCEDVDFQSGIVRVMGKGAKERMVRLGDNARRAVYEYYRKRNSRQVGLWLSTGSDGNFTNGALTSEGFKRHFRRLCQRANITGVKLGPHTCRHTTGTKYVENGGSLKCLQQLFGHSKITTTMVYVDHLGLNEVVSDHQKASPVDNLFGKNRRR